MTTGNWERRISAGRQRVRLSVSLGVEGWGWVSSPEAELLARLRLSSATQEKLQYPGGTPAVPPASASPAERNRNQQMAAPIYGPSLAGSRLPLVTEDAAVLQKA